MKVVPEKDIFSKEGKARYLEKPLAFLKIPDKAQTPTESVRSLGASPPQYLCI